MGCSGSCFSVCFWFGPIIFSSEKLLRRQYCVCRAGAIYNSSKLYYLFWVVLLHLHITFAFEIYCRKTVKCFRGVHYRSGVQLRLREFKVLFSLFISYSSFINGVISASPLGRFPVFFAQLRLQLLADGNGLWFGLRRASFAYFVEVFHSFLRVTRLLALIFLKEDYKFKV